MAEIIARAASKAGVKNIVMYNISKTHHSYILRDIFRYKGLIVGAPTYNAGLYHEMEVLLSELANKDVKNHLLGKQGSSKDSGVERNQAPLRASGRACRYEAGDYSRGKGAVRSSG